MGRLDGFTDSVDMSLSKLWETLEHRKDLHPAVHGVAERWTRPRLNNSDGEGPSHGETHPLGWVPTGEAAPHFPVQSQHGIWGRNTGVLGLPVTVSLTTF